LGCRWKHLEGADSVEFEPSVDTVILDVVDLEKRKSLNYIVALVEEGFQGPEAPFVLGMEFICQLHIS
jgi:hypothetical protein